MTPPLPRLHNPNKNHRHPAANFLSSLKLRQTTSPGSPRIRRALANPKIQVSEVEASMLRVYPQLRDWSIRLSSTADHLEARFAPRDSEPIALPQDPRRPQNAGFELWIRTTAAEAKVLARIGGWNQSQQVLKTYLEAHDVDVEDMSSQAQVVAIDDWLVVALGQAVTATSPVAGASSPSN